MRATILHLPKVLQAPTATQTYPVLYSPHCLSPYVVSRIVFSVVVHTVTQSPSTAGFHVDFRSAGFDLHCSSEDLCFHLIGPGRFIDSVYFKTCLLRILTFILIVSLSDVATANVLQRNWTLENPLTYLSAVM